MVVPVTLSIRGLLWHGHQLDPLHTSRFFFCLPQVLSCRWLRGYLSARTSGSTFDEQTSLFVRSLSNSVFAAVSASRILPAPSRSLNLTILVIQVRLSASCRLMGFGQFGAEFDDG